MKKIILPLFVLGAISMNAAKAQSNKAFAITGETKGNYTWTAIREIDLTNGNVLRTVYSSQQPNNVNYSFLNSDGVNVESQRANSPTINGVAAAAFDEKNNRLYFSPMWGNDLRYVDLSTNQLTVVVNNDARYSTGPRRDESNVITRMVIAADGNGYALTNDGNQLIQFTTGKNPVITNLGALVDAKDNKGVSIHSQCTSWGGDMIADIYGNLYLFTYRGYVFKINPVSLIAEHLGTVKNLPADFTTNGAAVDADGNVILTSAVKTENYYKVNLGTLQANVLPKTEATVYNASDLANGNLAYRNTKETPALTQVVKQQVSIYPNPAVNKTFAVQFSQLPVGNYNIELSDANGKRVFVKSLSINGFQNERITLPKGAAAGTYLVRVIGTNGKAVYTDKVLIQ